MIETDFIVFKILVLKDICS